VAISHSSATVAHDFGKYMGFDKVYGRLHEVDKRGRFTGKHLFVDTIDDKANLVKHLVDKKGYSLKGSIGVGDTESDIRFLELVEQPICFNPNLKLYKHAKRHGWTIVVERKDVIYVMNKEHQG
jgi:phosphoserine phosphatase